MLTPVSIKSLYTPALAEGEGVGTAYEYFAKRLALGAWLRERPFPIRRLLIAGLPQKYGASLDFVLLGMELGAEILVVDERPSALGKVQQSLAAAQADGWLPHAKLQTRLVAHLPKMAELPETFDLVVASEVLQRLPAMEQRLYLRRLHERGTAVALFAPNADNSAHTDLSGLAGVTLPQLQGWVGQLAGATAVQTGYIDMPPFPPGIVRDEAQREQASSGLFEATAMWGLGFYARIERLLPQRVRRRYAHIVYAFWSTA